MTTNRNTSSTSDREITISRVVSAPRELVWEAMTNPKHVVNWWGPRGFSTTIETMDFRVGGQWKHVMHGPDGANYPNKSTFKEITRPERIVFSHGGGHEDGPGASFVATWTFEAVTPVKTKVTINMVFPTPDARDFVVKEFGAIEGGKQTLARLGEHLDSMRATDRQIIISRVVDAPRELVWKAFTNPKHIVNWWGPRGFSTTIETMDVRVNGEWKLTMVGPDGARYPNRYVFTEIVEPGRVVLSHSGRREGGPDVTTVKTWTFETMENGRTQVTFCIEFPSAAERDSGVKEFGIIEGTRQTLTRLDEHLASMRATDRQIIVSRVVDAPRELVWEAFTNPKHVVNWWGPRGFSTTIEVMDVRVGGEWKHTMIGPDGTRYPNHHIYKELAKPQRIVLSHGGHREGGPEISAVATWTFETLEDGKTRVTGTMEFPSIDERDLVVKDYGAIEGGKQTLARLDEFLPQLKNQNINQNTNSTTMKSFINPYLNFEGRCDEALEFYKKAIGIKVGMVMRFKDAPDKSMISPGSEEKIMHADFTFGDSIVMASDGHCTNKGGFQGINLSLNVPDAATAEKYFNALSQGGQVEMPLTKTFFSPAFGMVKDRFGLMWMVHVPGPQHK